MTPAHAPAMTAQLDHLVIVARTLAEGVAWCQATLGVLPGPGGEHPLMGTHNRLVALHSDRHPQAYMEIIAINSGSNKSIKESEKRWFDMDFLPLQRHLAQHGPALVHWVARVPDAAHTVAALAHPSDGLPGWDTGPLLAASRATPQGELRWHITIRPDGQRLLGGCLPTLIEWGARHPTDHLPPSGLHLQALSFSHPTPDAVRRAWQVLGWPACELTTGPARLQATLQTPLGVVTLASPVLPAGDS